MPTLTDLPTELIVKILEAGLDYRSLVRSMVVCKTLQKVIKGSEKLAYLIELDAARLVDIPETTMSVPGRLRSLQRLQIAWSKMAPSRVDKYTIEQQTPGCLKLCQGHIYYSRGYRDSHDLVGVMRLPSALFGTKIQKWVLPPLPFAITSLEADPSQDLLVLSTSRSIDRSERRKYDLHILSMRSGQKHPLAKHQVIELPGIYTFWSLPQVQICGNYTSTFVTRDERSRRFVILNWRSGELKLSLNGVDFVTADLINSSHAISVVRRRREKTFELQVYTIREGEADDSKQAFEHIRSLELPEAFSPPSAGVEVEITCSSGGCRPLHYNPPPGVPFFRPSSPHHIIALRVAFSTTLQDSFRMTTLFIRIQSLLNNSMGSTSGELTPVPWEVWSVGNKSWYFPPRGFKEPCIEGERALVWEQAPSGHCRLGLLDMNAPLAGRERIRTPRSGESNRSASCLPQRVWHSRPVCQFISTTMMDDERVVLVLPQVLHVEGQPVTHNKRIEVWNMS